MRIEGAYTFPGDIGRVFTMLTNPDALARAIPGCERFIQFGPASAEGAISYETRLRLGQTRQPYTIALQVNAIRPPAYLTLDLRGHGPSGAITGSGSLDLVEQDDHTVVAYRFTINGAELPEIGDTPSQSASFLARATCAHLADELHAEREDTPFWLPGASEAADERAGQRARGVANPDARRVSLPLGWTERAVWLTAGLALGLGAIALTVGIVRRLGAHASHQE